MWKCGNWLFIYNLPAVLELLPGKDEPLLVRRDPLLVLDLGLHILDGVARLHLQGNGLTREGLDEDLHFDSVIKRIKLFRKFLGYNSLQQSDDWAAGYSYSCQTLGM